MTIFRPVIDLYGGAVVQIVGATLTGDEGELRTNFTADRPASWFASLYRDDELTGGHLIMLGPGNEEAAREAIGAYPGGLQVGGGITPDRAGGYLEAGASHVIVSSWLFDDAARLDENRLGAMRDRVGADRLVIDLSCRRDADGWRVAIHKWQTPTDCLLNEGLLDRLADSCDEYLIHAADVEGTCGGVDEELVRMLGAWSGRPITYAGGARALADLDRVAELSGNHVDLAIGSALDIFGGAWIGYSDCVAYNRRRQTEKT